MTELRQEIARALRDSLESTAPDCPHGCRVTVAPDFNAVIYGHVSLIGLANALLPLISKAEQRGAERMRERAAKVVEEGQETISSTRDGERRHLTPRAKGNQLGLAFANAIRALPPLPTEEE